MAMDITIDVKEREVSSGDFHYGNIESSYGVNTLYFTKNGRPYTIVAGEMHFSRLPRERWRSTLLKMRDCGINTVSSYVFWNHHNEIKYTYEFSGNKDIAAFLRLCREIHMPCILRIGPWCHGEAARGGFPRRIERMIEKRSNAKKYIKPVRVYWNRLYKEIAEFMDGESLIAIQLENEYCGPIEHLLELRRIAEYIGFKAPFFTMTAWPSGIADNRLLPTMGGYPDAPWTPGVHPLEPNNRFAISPAKTEDEIGADLHQNTAASTSTYKDVPYALCETGPGNQVTQHRRPYISEKDGYGVGFAKFASGANWLGYYMFCGGANPNDRLMQESIASGYPNDYPVIDYDFQAPISRYGECRPHGDALRLMHLFIREFDNEICTKQAFFPEWRSNNPRDISFLKCSVRCNASGSGYFFAGAYEKGLEYEDFHNVRLVLRFKDKSIELPEIDVKAGSMFFYPFNINLGGIDFSYILAQPIAKLKDAFYFTECEGIAPRCKTRSAELLLNLSEQGNIIKEGEKQIKIIVLPAEKAKQLHIIDGKAVFAEGSVYSDDEFAYCESIKDEKGEITDLKEQISLEECPLETLPLDLYLHSKYKRRYYKLRLPENILEKYFDLRLEFLFEGLNLQVFSGETLINDYFNIDGKFVMNLRDYSQYLKEDSGLTIRCVPKTESDMTRVYNEIPIPLCSKRLELTKAQVIFLKKTALNKLENKL